jgi:ERF superfamily
MSGLIYKKITDVMMDMDAIGKSRTNQAQGFKFRGIDDIYNEIHPLLAKHKIFTVPTIKNRQYRDRTTSNGKVMVERILTIQYRFFAEDASFVDAEVDGEAMDTGDKTTNKCMAIAHKYALLQVFCVPTEDKEGDEKDPDAHTPPAIKAWRFDERSRVRLRSLVRQHSNGLGLIREWEAKNGSIESIDETEYQALCKTLESEAKEAKLDPQSFVNFAGAENAPA